MDIDADDVDTVHDCLQFVTELRDFAEDNDTPFKEDKLDILIVQLDALHQALSLIVASGGDA